MLETSPRLVVSPSWIEEVISLAWIWPASTADLEGSIALRCREIASPASGEAFAEESAPSRVRTGKRLRNFILQECDVEAKIVENIEYRDNVSDCYVRMRR